MNRPITSLLAAVLGVVATSALAQDPGPGQGQPRPERRERGPEGREGREGREGGGPGGRGNPRMRLSPLMQALDTNKDGELSAEEIANAPAALRKLDKDGDGKLSAEELRPAGMEGGPRGPGADNIAERLASLMAFDKNGDGKLSADEMPERMKNIVTRADANKDGFATREELTALLAAQGERRGPGGPGGGPEGERPRPRREQE